ncbi:MAG: hypothetical protein AAGH68_11285, partial [Pseudomonadota bacterium]
MTDIIYFAIAFVGLTGLCTVLAIIGRAAAECPQIGAAAKVGTWVVTTGFCAIGVGIIAIGAALLPLLTDGRSDGLYWAIGIVSIVLGIG